MVFGKEVFAETAEDASKYTISKNGSTYTATGTLTATLLDDKKTVILSDVSGGTTQNQILANGNSYRVTVDGVVDKDYNKFPKFTSEIAAFNDLAAPTVVKSELKGSTIRVYFNEPVTGGTIKIDNGTAVTPTSYVNADGVHYATLTASAAQQAAGTHKVTVYNFQDAQGNTLPVATSSYTVSADTTAPAVQSITAASAYTFKVKVSEPLVGEPTVTVKKGNLVLPLDTTYGGGNGIALDATDTSNTTYIVKVADASASNPVYATGETSVNLSVKVSNIKDNANLVGAEFNGTVTLSKDAAAPTVVSANLNTADTTNNYLYVRFNEDLNNTFSTDGALDSKIVVTKNGVQLPVSAASVQNDVNGDPTLVRITLASVTPGTYNVKFLAGAVSDVDSNVNAEVSTTVAVADPTALVTPGVTQPAANVIQVAFGGGVDMTDSATTLSNYTLDGQALPAGTTIGFYNNKQTVRITLPSNLYSQSTVAQLKISKNVKNENGVPVLASANPETEYTTQVSLTDNVKPVLESAKFLVTSTSATTSNKVQLTFSEDLGTAPAADDLKVTVNGSEVTVSNITLNGDVVTFNIPTTVIAQGVQVKVLPASEQTDASMDAADVAGNKLTEGTIVTATEKVLDTGAIAQDAADVAADKADVNVTAAGAETLTTLKSNVTLVAPATNGSTITWSSSDSTVVSNAGVVARPIFSAGNANVTLTATIAKGTASDTKPFALTVLKKDFAANEAGTPDETFTITGDGYALTDFSVANIDMDDAQAGAQSSITVNGLTYTVSYNDTTGVATIAVTGTATANAAATTETIEVSKDGKVVPLTLNIPAVTAADAAATVAVTVTE